MAPPRRVRDELLVLRGRGDLPSERELSRARRMTHFDDLDTGPLALPTQRRYQVSPDARVLAYAVPSTDEVRLLRRDGAELVIPGVGERDLRFSPDGRLLAVVTGGHPASPIRRVDLRTFAAETWAELLEPSWIEYCADGLVVLHAADSGRGHALTLLPWSGAPRRLADIGWSGRFVTAKAGTRVVYFAGEEVWSLDTARQDPPRLVARTRSPVRNAEMSPDGRRVACATDAALLIMEGDAAPTVLDEQPGIHSVWFSRDGAALTWASPLDATLRRGDEQRRLKAPRGDLATLRFVQAGEGLVVTRGREVLLWTPALDREEVITRVEGEVSLLGADLCAAGVVLWLGTPWEERFPIRQKGSALDAR